MTMRDWRDFYAKVTNPFRSKSRFYTGAGHHGVDFAAAPHEEIPTYFDGVCVLNGHSSFIGNWSVYRRDDGQYAGYAHLLVGTRRDVGTRVKAGDSVGRAATYGDDTGSSWQGSHCHTTVGKSKTSIYDGTGVDPAPSIAAYRAAKAPAAKPAGGTKKTPGAAKTKVRSGEGGIAVANRLGISLDRLKKLNPKVEDWNHLKLGQALNAA